MTPGSAVTPARRATLRVLGRVSAGALLDGAFADATTSLDDRDRRWARQCTFGTLRLRGRLDHLLDAYVRRGLASVDAPLADLLRMGAFQLLYMEGVPAYAAVSQAVDQAREVASPGAARLVNGVLRAVGRGGADPGRFPDRESDPAGFLSTWHSHPRWLVERWLERWPFPVVLELVKANNQVPSVYLRPLGVRPDTALEALGPGARPSVLGSGCVELPSGLSPPEALGRVRGIIQDPAAALVTHYADIPSGWLVADLCAAPGGKAVALAETAGYVVAADRSVARLRRLQETVERLGSRMGVVAARAEAPPLREAPGVLVDAPCSGTGTVRRHPDSKWRLRSGDIEALAGVQRAILDGAAALVPSGGLLVYATCTLEPEENEEQVKSFLTRHPEYSIEATDAVAPELLDGAGRLFVAPWASGSDGAFAARLRRVS
jgi:16S rRNA (cytosine967-C5)-methyltransferase